MTVKDKTRQLNKKYKELIEILTNKRHWDELEYLISPNFAGYGSTIDEKFSDFKGVAKMVKMQDEQAEGFKVEFKFHEVFRDYENENDWAVFIDEITVALSSDQGVNEIQLRFSCLMVFEDEDWKVKHFHGSVAVETEEDTWHMEEWQQKMDRLEALVDKQTEELQLKNKELKIEASLERVRAKGMAMHHTSELQNVINTVHKQLNKLDIPITGGVFIAINAENKKEINCWGAGGTADYVERVSIPFLDKTIYTGLIQNLQKKPGLYTEAFSAEEKKEFFEHLFKLPPYNKTSKKRKEEVMAREGGYTRSSAVSKNTSIFIINHHGRPFTDSENTVLLQFGRVFEQAFTRFLDLKKAEGQAREAQIEAALERVRSRTMGMQNSSELSEVAQVMFEQISLITKSPDRFNILLPIENDTSFEVWLTDQEGHKVQNKFVLSSKKSPVVKGIYKAWQRKESKFHKHLKGKELLEWINYISDVLGIPYKKSENKDNRYINLVYFNNGYIGTTNNLPQNNETTEIIERFAKVFEQTYTRFLDLEKAEKQARKAQINLAVERVRAKALAMNKSEEIMEVVAKLKDEVMSLDIPDVVAATIFLKESENRVRMWDLSTLEKDNNGYQIPFDISFKLNKIDPHLYVKRVWENDKDFFLEQQGPKDFKRLMAWLRENNQDEIAQEIEHYMEKTNLICLYHAAKKLNKGKLVIDTLSPPTDEMESILTKIGESFDLAYKRFEDLKKAETQAREARIEAALERVRSRSLAMHSSEELGEVVTVLVEKLRELKIPVQDGVAIVTHIEGSKDQIEWMENPGYPSAIKIHQTYFDHPILVDYWNAKKKGLDFIAPQYSTEENKSFLNHIFEHTEYKNSSDEIKAYCLSAKSYSYSAAFQKHSSIFINHYSGEVLSPSEIEVVKRFSKVFEQSYIRFLDLQKAEEQAREAKIEAALERVRSQSMGMQSTDDFGTVTTEMFNQLRNFGEELFATGIVFCDKHEGHVEQWHSIPGAGMVSPFIVPIDLDYIHQYRYDQWKKGEKLFSIEIPGDFIDQHFEDIFKLPSAQIALKDLESRDAPMPDAPSWEIDYGASFKHGYVLISSLKPLENTDILLRFTTVFEQAYQRYLDLQKAEERAREAQVEAALERVRSKAMAMRSSEDISEAINILFKEIEKLNIQTIRCGIGIIQKNKVMDAWTTTITDGKEVIRLTGQLDMTIHPMLEKVFEGWEKKKQNVEYELSGEDGENYYKALQKGSDYVLPESNIIKETHYLTAAMFTQGALYVFTKNRVSQDSIILFHRFAKVFELTYQRYRELIESEIREKEAKRQASLDRVRGEIASMRSKEDLNRITPIIWRELTNLGVPFFRCGVFIINEEQKNIQVFLSDPEGNSLGLMNLDYETTSLTSKTVKSWQKSEVFRAHWNKEEFINWTNTLIELGKIETPTGYQGGKNAPESLDLHFVPFTQGMLYVGNLEPLNTNQIDLVKNLAESFSIAYARYEDFNKLENAKKSIETALNDLKATQKQLVQSEKMASLGELTAGIAHEIQNPLNFVNNFSDLSIELIGEIDEELKKGEIEEVNAILKDIKDNLKKIYHHGKRADDIVKGMLEHSRKSTGEKQPTDINKLCDEYIRLSYHGLRAKDKSFNSTIKTKFDKNIDKIAVVQQDIGRVILNLVNNAFYATSELKTLFDTDLSKFKKLTGQSNYNPTVSITTKKEKDRIEISVRDNGHGIPKQLVEKIFQPFFTTKPTGQGTGLGLSLSYDIIKAHGGSLEVDSQEGNGSTFKIILKTNL